MDKPGLQRETALWNAGLDWVAGVDEVGRGCLSGPVVTAAVVLPPRCTPLDGVRDSKKLSLKQRETLFLGIKQQALRYAWGAASVAEIERLNILHASHLAMRRALRRVEPYHHGLIDGNHLAGLDPARHEAVVGGDRYSYAIACASILAKVARDRLMCRLAERYPGYAWERNAGYGTRAHLEALARLGVTPLHRRDYAPVRQALAQGSLPLA